MTAPLQQHSELESTQVYRLQLHMDMEAADAVMHHAMHIGMYTVTNFVMRLNCSLSLHADKLARGLLPHLSEPRLHHPFNSAETAQA